MEPRSISELRVDQPLQRLRRDRRNGRLLLGRLALTKMLARSRERRERFCAATINYRPSAIDCCRHVKRQEPRSSSGLGGQLVVWVADAFVARRWRDYPTREMGYPIRTKLMRRKQGFRLGIAYEKADSQSVAGESNLNFLEGQRLQSRPALPANGFAGRKVCQSLACSFSAPFRRRQPAGQCGYRDLLIATTAHYVLRPGSCLSWLCDGAFGAVRDIPRSLAIPWLAAQIRIQALARALASTRPQVIPFWLRRRHISHY